MEEEGGGLLRSKKLVLHLTPPENVNLRRPIAKSSASNIKLAFTEGGCTQMKAAIENVLADKHWEKLAKLMPNLAIQNTGPVPTRSGIVGIERKIQQKIQTTSSNISMAFQDLKNLMDMAKDMVHLANSMSVKIKERQGDISEDETVKFKSYLLSLGITDPVTRNACTSGDVYRKQLAKQISEFLFSTVSETGGLMALSDAYCRVNRARGLDLLSPEDFMQACHEMKDLNCPIILRRFESGVYVLQLRSQSDTDLDKETAKLVGFLVISFASH
nr:EOG090X09MN [Ilyocryptus agilis]